MLTLPDLPPYKKIKLSKLKKLKPNHMDLYGIRILGTGSPLNITQIMPLGYLKIIGKPLLLVIN